LIFELDLILILEMASTAHAFRHRCTPMQPCKTLLSQVEAGLHDPTLAGTPSIPRDVVAFSVPALSRRRIISRNCEKNKPLWVDFFSSFV